MVHFKIYNFLELKYLSLLFVIILGDPAMD